MGVCMDCSKVLDAVYEYSGGERMPLLLQLRVSLHVITCPDCAKKIERFQFYKTIIREDFFPPLPSSRSSQSVEDTVMSIIAAEKETFAVPGGLSIRGWIIAGLVITLSLVTAFFGLDFHKIAREAGASFLLPVGITIGIVLTSYGALFIGSHLKELSERFGL